MNTNLQNLEILSSHFDYLKPADKSFGRSLLNAKRLSVKQWYWVGVLAGRALDNQEHQQDRQLERFDREIPSWSRPSDGVDAADAYYSRQLGF